MTAPLWTRTEAAAATRARVLGPDWSAAGVSIDSRKVGPGDLFIALEGERVDGHDFVAAALDNGAAAALVARVPDNLPDDAPWLVVDSVLEGLVDLAKAARTRSNARIVAVTGSVGKTGSKEMLATALSALGKTRATVGNLNNHIGAPLSLARLEADCDFAVFELGMNHADEIRPLSRLVAPHVAMITNVEAVHIEFFDNGIDGVADAKAEILECLQPHGTAVLNRDNASFDRLYNHARRLDIDRVTTFGSDSACTVQLLEVEPAPDHTRVVAVVAGRRLSWTVGGIGRHWGINSAGVVATLHALNVDLEPCLEQLARVSAKRGRGGQVRLSLPDGDATLIDESYNASPPAIRAALAVFATTPMSPGGRRILALGDMLELGATEREAHAALSEAVRAARPHAVYLCGPRMEALRDALGPDQVTGYADTAADLAEQVADAVVPGDVLLIKGSLGMGMKAIVEAVEARTVISPPAANGTVGR